ncbi:uncharacterized protein LOC129302952 [Prosopis cineraria]|uniref:uncharacterized protein LOC129302952 n=1 Tax=Prosopis cineraria TaxID=364024 RepID=UPI00240EADF7|nr:uncharacterized protein LOC129302952 [Prosopis cineraria]
MKDDTKGRREDLEIHFPQYLSLLNHCTFSRRTIVVFTLQYCIRECLVFYTQHSSLPQAPNEPKRFAFYRPPLAISLSSGVSQGQPPKFSGSMIVDSFLFSSYSVLQ